jgi:tetratricopeptide (TPR) repeat protein
MSASNWPTQSAEALLSFVEGRDLLRQYLESGRADDLERARASFAEAERNDPTFALATFYLAVVESELRDSDSAISRLQTLVRGQVDFLPETYLQLAYAHTKKYEDSDFFAARDALDQAQKQAEARRRRDMFPVIEAYRTFLFSVMGGRLQQGDRKPYIDEAIELGSRLLTDRSVTRLPDREQVLFEVRNALGISYMRRGQQEAAFSEPQRRAWELAERNYAEALKLRPNATRVLQNIGTLRRAEGDQFFRKGGVKEAQERYRVARELYRRSLDLNPRDQFPHYRMSELAARQGDWDTALRYYNSGRQEKGAVKAQTWEQLFRAIYSKDASGLLTYD